MDIKLLDCTLRDGGYVNDWNFGNSVIKYMLQRYINAGLDVIEIGFLDERREADINRTIFPNMEALNSVFEGIDKKKAKLVAMIDYGTCNIDNLLPQSKSLIDGIRIIFKKPNMYKAIEYARQVIKKGYFVSLNLVSITAYKDRDILDFCDAVNEIKPYAVSIVDTYGLRHKEQMQHYFATLNRNLEPSISIGYHSHNNFQLAYSNTIELLNMKAERTIILDGSAYGMGKSAGNAPIELLAMHLNDHYGKKYDINQILEIIETAVMPIYKRTPWGYSLLFYLAASNNCHPNYITYLLDKCTLSVESINKIANKISPDKRLNYDKEYIKKLYDEYQNVRFDDEETIGELRRLYAGKNILLIGPGKSITYENEKINDYINYHDVEVIAVNFVPKHIKADALFIGNSKRYGTMIVELAKSDIPIIGTSNVSSLNKEFKYYVNCERVLDEGEDISDNSLAMILNLFFLIKPKSVMLSGFDGYDVESARDLYCDESFNLSEDFERLSRVNQQLTRKIAMMKTELSIKFLTPSVYEGK